MSSLGHEHNGGTGLAGAGNGLGGSSGVWGTCFLGRGRGFLVISEQPKDLVFQKDREHNTSHERNEAIFTRLRYGWGLRLDLLINIHFGDT